MLPLRLEAADAIPSVEETRVHRAARRRGGGAAARGAGAAGGAVADHRVHGVNTPVVESQRTAAFLIQRRNHVT
jgi:hypothetical protein